MDAKSRKALSWSLSILVHATILFFIIRAGIHYMIPEGEVTTGQTIDVIEGNSGGPKNDLAAADKMVPSLPAHSQVKEPKYKITTKDDAVQKESDNEPPPQFIPDKEPQDVIPEDKTEDTDSAQEQTPKVETADNEQAPVVPPPAPTETPIEAPKTVAKSLPQKTETSETKTEEQNPEEMQPVQETQNPEPPPSNAETAAAPPSESQNSGAQAPQTPSGTAPQANSGGSDHPAFGAPGTMLDESKLVEVPGNVKPTYPWMAKLRRQEGTVVLRAYIKSDGRVDLPILDKSSGFASLDQECIRAYSHWKYKPGPSGWVLKPFHFALKKN